VIIVWTFDGCFDRINQRINRTQVKLYRYALLCISERFILLTKITVILKFLHKSAYSTGI